MTKIIFTVLATVFSLSFCLAQDTITLRTGETILAKVLEVGPAQIRYVHFSNLNGPAYLLSKSDVSVIHYENGTRGVFNNEQKAEKNNFPDSSNTKLFVKAQAVDSSTTDLFVRGQSDAIRYYKGYKAAGTGTLITALLSPLVGLVPAIACSVTKPKENKLNYPNPELMKIPSYRYAYTERAKKIKQGKVWKNWGIAFGVNLLLVLALNAGG